MAVTVGCVWLANGEGPLQERDIQRLGEGGGKLVRTAPAKGDFVSVANHYRLR